MPEIVVTLGKYGTGAGPLRDPEATRLYEITYYDPMGAASSETILEPLAGIYDYNPLRVGMLVRIKSNLADFPEELHWLFPVTYWVVMLHNETTLRLYSATPNSERHTLTWLRGPSGKRAFARGGAKARSTIQV